MSNSIINLGNAKHSRGDPTGIYRLIELTRSARDGAIELDMKFEAYLLDMSLIALLDKASNRP